MYTSSYEAYIVSAFRDEDTEMCAVAKLEFATQ